MLTSVKCTSPSWRWRSRLTHRYTLTNTHRLTLILCCHLFFTHFLFPAGRGRTWADRKWDRRSRGRDWCNPATAGTFRAGNEWQHTGSTPWAIYHYGDCYQSRYLAGELNLYMPCWVYMYRKYMQCIQMLSFFSSLSSSLSQCIMVL